MRARRLHGHGPLLVAIGDSNTDPQGGYTLPWQVWLRVVGRQGFRTLNLGVSGDTTRDMRRRIEQTLSAGQPDIVVLFGGVNDARCGIDLADTEQNVTFMVRWLREHGVGNVVLIGPTLVNWQPPPEWMAAADAVGRLLSDVAEREGLQFVDLTQFFRARIARGADPDFSRVRYAQSRSWHIAAGDPHLNAYGQRLVAAAFLGATTGPVPSLGHRRLWRLRRRYADA
jgi:lysophospholipase L1-like esterase